MSILPRHLTHLGLAAVLLSSGLAAQALEATGEASAQIRRTTFGVPHILAKDERSLGYGIGYAYAQDNLCLLANEVLTVNGERARYFGARGKAIEQRENLDSDTFFAWLNTDSVVNAFLQAQPDLVRQRLEGYAAGYNRALAERKGQGLPVECGSGDWLRPITSLDLAKLTRRLLAEGASVNSSRRWWRPHRRKRPSEEGRDFSAALARQAQFASARGSNAVAVGAERSSTGGGLLLANPHFPWEGGMRFIRCS